MPMLSREQYQILKMLNESTEPLGSGTISERMGQIDIAVSEATIGRFLRNLDSRGFTKKLGFQGRCLTEEGIRTLEKYEHEKNLQVKTNHIMNLAKAEAKDELLSILVARKAIEKETCRLAAEKIKDEEINIIANLVEKHFDHAHGGVSGAKEDSEFHSFIARIGGNKFLEAALDLIRQDGQLSPVFEFIRNKVGSTIVEDHENILKALKNRNPLEAEKAMAMHLDNVIYDVQKYWHEVNE